MKIAILGAGALGCFYAAKLSQKFPVVLAGRDEKKIKKICKDGISVTGLSRLKSNKENLCAVTSTKNFPHADLLIVLVKAYDTENAVRQHRALIGKDTLVLTLQNGLGNVDAIRQGIGYRVQGIGEKKAQRHKGASACACPHADRKAHSSFPMVYAGITAHGVTAHEPGVVSHAGRGETVIGYRVQGIGYRKKEKEKLLEIVNAFEECGIVTKLTNDIEGALWGKLVLNCAINPVAALLQIKNGVIPQNPHSFFLAKSALLEAVEIAERKKIKLPYVDPVKKLADVCEATRGNVNSMLQDVMNKKRTEIDTINGAVVREAKKLRMDAPVNRALTLLVKAVERCRVDA